MNQIEPMNHTIPLHSKVIVNDTTHANITTGMIGKVTGLLDDGYEVYFEKPLVSESFRGVSPSPVHMFMRPQDIKIQEEPTPAQCGG